MEWQPIETAPDGKKMFVVISATDMYITDPYCVWKDSRGLFVRWPHKFKPTHWAELPEHPEPRGTE